MTDAQATALLRDAGSSMLGVEREAVEVGALEPMQLPGSGEPWRGAKVRSRDGVAAVVVNLVTHEVMPLDSYLARARAEREALGPIHPLVAQRIAALGPDETLTVAVLLHGGRRSEIIDQVAAQFAGTAFVDGVPSGPPTEVDAAARALRNEYRAAAAAIEDEYRQRAEAEGLTVEYAAWFAPLVYVTGTAAQIRATARLDRPLAILESTTTRQTMSSAWYTDQADFAASQGWKGMSSSGYRVRVAVVEYGNVMWTRTDLSSISSSRRMTIDPTYPSSNPDPEEHPSRVMATIASQGTTNRGIAPEAFYVTSGTGGQGSPGTAQDFRVLAAIDRAVDASIGNADVVNLSIIQDTAAGASALTAYVDEVARSLNVHFTTSGGNPEHCDGVGDPSFVETNHVRPAGDAWNSITVGGIDDNNTGTIVDDDTVWSHCYIDPANGPFKPEISAPAVSIASAGYPAAPGVSFANPQVAGATTAVIGINTSELRLWPVKTKAIQLAASQARRTIWTGQVLQHQTGLNDHEGLGTLTVKWAGRIAARQSYGGQPLGNFGSWTAAGAWNGSTGCYETPSIATVPVSTGHARKVRFVIDWLSHGFYTEGSGFGTNDAYADERLSDIDLFVYDNTGSLVDYSDSINHNVEWVEWTYDSTKGPYEVRIDPYSWDCSLASEKIGWAWVAWSAP